MSEILLVMRKGFHRTGLRVEIEQAGFGVLEAEDPDDALALVGRWPFTTVVLDPMSATSEVGVAERAGNRREGLQLVRDMKALQARLGIIVYTNVSDLLDDFLAIVADGVRGLAYTLQSGDPNAFWRTVRAVCRGAVEIDEAATSRARGLVQALYQSLTPDEAPWVERAVPEMRQLTRQEARAAELLATSHNLTGVARAMAIQRADTLIGRVYLRLGLRELPNQANHLRQNALLLKAWQIYALTTR